MIVIVCWMVGCCLAFVGCALIVWCSLLCLVVRWRCLWFVAVVVQLRFVVFVGLWCCVLCGVRCVLCVVECLLSDVVCHCLLVLFVMCCLLFVVGWQCLFVACFLMYLFGVVICCLLCVARGLLVVGCC